MLPIKQLIQNLSLDIPSTKGPTAPESDTRTNCNPITGGKKNKNSKPAARQILRTRYMDITQNLLSLATKPLFLLFCSLIVPKHVKKIQAPVEDPSSFHMNMWKQ